MALHQFLCALTVIIILSHNGCRSQQPKCGRAQLNSRIVGGQSASPGAWPWQAQLEIDTQNTTLLCGGSLISNQWVLTAAHCAVGVNNITAHLGRHRMIGANPNEVSLTVEWIICHPFYRRWSYDNDICLLKLQAPVNFTNYIYPVCLASANSTFYTGVSSWVTGFGVTFNGTLSNILQELNVPVVGNNECRCAYPYHLTENMICAGHRAGGKGSCQGDSGGPLVTKNGSVWVLAGVVSFGIGCGQPRYPGVYARVSQYQEWISNVTGSSQVGFVTFTSPGVDSDLNFTCPTSHPTTPPRPPTPYPTYFPTKDGNSVFDGGDSVIPFSHFVSLCALVLSLYALVGDT